MRMDEPKIFNSQRVKDYYSYQETPSEDIANPKIGPVYLEDFIKDNPPTKEIKETIKSIGHDHVFSGDSDHKEFYVLRAIKELETLTKSQNIETDSVVKLCNALDWLSSIYGKYYLEEEKSLSKITYSGERFKNKYINRVLQFQQIDDDSISRQVGYKEIFCYETPDFEIKSFDNEWRKLYLLSGNRGDVVLRQGIINSVSSFIQSFSDELNLDDNDDEDNSHVNHEQLEGCFDNLDSFFNINNCNAEDIEAIIEILFSAVEYSKRIYDPYEEPNEYGIDEITYEDSDGASSLINIIYDYTNERLKPKLTTFFQKIKILSTTNNLAESDSHYSILESSITLSSEELGNLRHSRIKKMPKGLSPNRLLFKIGRSYIAEYSEDSCFYLYNKKGDTFENTSIHDMLEDNGVNAEKVTEDFIAKYRRLLDLKVRAYVEKRVGFSLSLLDIPAQIAFLEFISLVTEDQFNDFCLFINKYDESDRVSICSCYLAFSEEKNFSYMVERLCDHEGIGLPLVRHVSKLIGNAQEIKEFLQKEFKTNYEKKNISSVHEKLIKRAYDLFLKYNSEVFSLETIREIEPAHNLMEDVGDNLAFDKGGQDFGERASYNETRGKIAKKVEEDCNAELFSQTLFINSFKTLHESGAEFSLEDIKSSKFEQLESGAITESDVAAMRSIYSHNQKESAVHDALLTSFDKKVKDPKTRFIIFKWQDKIQSFVAFSDKDDSLYMSAFNVSPDARGYKIGEAMLDQVVEQEARESTLTADCDSKLPISAKYIETGWIGTFYWEDKNEKEKKSDWVLDITRDDRSNKQYWGKNPNTTKEAIMLQRVHPENVKVEVAKTQTELPFQLCNKGYVLTRMFKDEGSGLCYGVFELSKREETTHE